jgi:hypothetical protein
LALNEFIPEIWSAKTLVALEKQHVFASLCNRDYDGEIAHMGDTVRITGIGDITVSDYTKDTDIAAPQARTSSTRPASAPRTRSPTPSTPTSPASTST